MAIKKTIKAKTEDGKEITLCIKTPTASELQKAQMEANKVFRLALESGALLRTKLIEFLVAQGLWNDEMQAKLEALADKIYEKERILLAGGIKRSEAKKVCVEITDLRVEQHKLLLDQRKYDLYTAEAQAENANFDFLVSVCVLDEEGNRYFANLDDYKNRAIEDAASEAASAVAEVVKGYDPDWEKKLPENKFLLQHKFVNEDLKFIDKDGNLVDYSGRPMDKDGYHVNDKGERVNLAGEKIDNEGQVIMEFKPLLDDDEEVKENVEVTKEEAVPA
jgi:hypothetical protein